MKEVWYIVSFHLGWDNVIGIYASKELAQRASGEEDIILRSYLETEEDNFIEDD